ncbi:hypothetical protein ACFL3J_01950 [Candidatus Omnitrophota bacterium]
MGVFQAVASGFSTAAKSIKLWLLLVIISFVIMAVSIPIIIATFGPNAFQAGGAGPSPADVGPGGIAIFVIMIIVAIVVQVFLNAGTVGTLKDTVKSGSLNLGGFVANAKKLFVKFLIFGIVMFLIMALAMVVFILLGGVIGAIGNQVNILGIVLGLILFVIFAAVAVLLGSYGSLGPIVIAAEDKGLGEAMSKALAFLKANFWKVLGLLIVLLAIFGIAMFVMFVLFFVIGLVLGVSSGGAAIGGGTELTINIVSRVIWNLVGTYLTLIFISSLISYYLGNAGSTQAAGTAPQA